MPGSNNLFSFHKKRNTGRLTAFIFAMIVAIASTFLISAEEVQKK